ncbi:MAG: aminoglycoside phosphotransferase family protein [Bacilli bacterium]|nr:aminoglycoside phosphotransferase family protein [Bacilli bacterium]
MDINLIIQKLNLETDNYQIEPFKSEEDGSNYEVWKIITDKHTFVLKKAKNYELSIYNIFLKQLTSSVPHLYKTIKIENDEYVLMEYIEGHTMSKCDLDSLIKVVDALIKIQKKFWKVSEPDNFMYSFDKTFESRKKRGTYLNDSELAKAYSKFLEYYEKLPRTLCHDDLLPFNVLINDKAWIIDWEYAGIMPYLTSFTRLIAHSEEKEDAFFYMKDADKKYIIDYYYEHLAKEKGITYQEYQLALKYFILYEYAEWIMLGVKYDNKESLRYQEYFKKAKQLVKELQYEN